MKKVLAVITVFLLVITSAVAAGIPKGKDYANDYANVLSGETKEFINNKGRAFQASDGTQIVAVTVESLEGASIEDFAYDLFNGWGIGDENQDNGVLILLSVGDREVRVEVGDGMEGILNDAKVGRLIDSLAMDHFAKNDFDSGILALYNGIVEVVGNPGSYSETEEDGDLSGAIIIVILLVLFSLINGGRGGRRRIFWWGGRGGWGGPGGFGGFGGGSSGGGFGGFGGGGSSGGGASRKF